MRSGSEWQIWRTVNPAEHNGLEHRYDHEGESQTIPVNEEKYIYAALKGREWKLEIKIDWLIENSTFIV